MVEDGHADPAVAGPRLNELSAKKRDLTSQLSVRQDDAPLIAPGDSAAKLSQASSRTCAYAQKTATQRKRRRLCAVWCGA